MRHLLQLCTTNKPWLASTLALLLSAMLPAIAEENPSTAAPETSSKSGINWNEARRFWSFQKPARHATPRVSQSAWPQQPIDYFVLAGMDAAGLAPSPEADKTTLIRRVTFTLTGLPPTPSEVEDFLADNGAGAYERLVDRLLSTSAFGERMASLWLNLARYAEDQAHQVGDDTKQFYPNAFLYRQWVIDAFNADLPYDRFIRLQLAADLVAPGDTNQLPAVGFIGLGPKYYNRGKLEVMADEWEDRVDTVSRTFQGLTVACARCHDHKFDPIEMEDYYALAGIFASTRMVNRPFVEPKPEPQPEPEKAETDKKTKKDKEPDNRLAMHVVEEGEAKNLHVFLRGNVENEGPEAPRRFLRILCGDTPAPYAQGSGRRELAEAIASPDNPLTARVMVNRLWQATFGSGLVLTPSNFGHMGEKPSHPELLDDLAVRFMAGGWSMKRLMREFVVSSTFRQSSLARAEQQTKDPANRWLSRMNRWRLPAEMWRDAVLFVSGELMPEGGASRELDDPSNRRRTVYGRISRLKLNDFLMQFDYPDANVHSADRSSTVTPLQKLFVLNSPFMVHQSQALAERIGSGTDQQSETARVQHIYQLLYARPPTEEESRLGLKFLNQSAGGDFPAWAQYAQALLAGNEMIYID